jgi:hypothetical protein
MKKTYRNVLLAAAAAAGLACGNVFAAAVSSDFDVQAGQGESPETLAAQAKLGITKFEEAGKEGGLGAPSKTLIDNDKIKVNLVAFKKGFVRPGQVKRPYDTLLVYVDPGAFTITHGGGSTKPTPAAEQKPSRPPRGSAVFHRKNSIVSESRIDEDYRVLFVMVK